MSGSKNLDFDQLEAELTGLAQEESLYWLRNDAKFRAVQNTSSYEEFQNIVKVATQKKTFKAYLA